MRNKTVFTMPCWKKTPDSAPSSQNSGSRLLASLLLAGSCWLITPAPAEAAEAEVRNLQTQLVDDQLLLSADINAELNSRLEEAVTRGVALYFLLEIDVSKPRWYWLDEKVSEKNILYRLSWNALTRQYRLSVGALHRNFTSLEEAMRAMLRPRNMQITEKNQVRNNEIYQISFRFSLDISRLPKPFQVSAIGNRDWSLSTDWIRQLYPEVPVR